MKTPASSEISSLSWGANGELSQHDKQEVVTKLLATMSAIDLNYLALCEIVSQVNVN